MQVELAKVTFDKEAFEEDAETRMVKFGNLIISGYMEKIGYLKICRRRESKQLFIAFQIIKVARIYCFKSW